MSKKKNGAKKTAVKADDAAMKLIGTWQGRLEDAKKNQKPIFDVARENYQIWYAKTPDSEKSKSPWRSNTFLPLLPGKGRDAKAKMSVLEPRFKVIPADAWKMNHKTNEMSFDDKALAKSMKVSKKLNRDFISFSSTGDLPPRTAVEFSETDAFVAGWGLALAPLKTYKKSYNQFPALKDADGKDSAYADRTVGSSKKEILRMSTELIPLDIFRTYLSPKAKSWETSPWIIVERDESYYDLDKCNSGHGEQIYDLPAELKDAKSTKTKNDYSNVREEAIGYQADGGDKKDDSVNQFNVYDCYDDELNRIYTFVEASLPSGEHAHKGWIKIRDIKNPYDHGMIPIIPFYVKRRPHSPWGESFFEIAKEVQYAYNAVYNQFRDNALLSTETGAVVDKNSIISDYEIEPGFTLEYDSLNGEKPEQWKFTDPNPAVLSAQMDLLEKGAEMGTVPQYTSGQVDSSMDKTAGTKGGIAMLMEAANDKISEMYRNLKGSLLRYGYMSLHNAQQFQTYIEVLDTPDMTASGMQKFRNGERSTVDVLTPMDLQEAYDLDIDDESLLPISKAERRALYKEFVDTLIALQGASIKQAELFDTPEDVMRIDFPDISKEMGNQYGELNAPAFIRDPLTDDQVREKKRKDAIAAQQAQDESAQVAAQNNPGADVSQDPNGLSVQYQKRELGNIDKYPADVANQAYASLGYEPSALLEEQAKAQMAEHKSKQIDADVKENMVAMAASGKLDPEQLSKFIKK